MKPYLPSPRTVFITIVSIVLTAFLTLTALIYGIGEYFERRDPCTYWHPGMTTEEKIKTALHIVNNVSRPVQVIDPLSAGMKMFKLDHIPYDSVDEILQQFPNCCPIFADQHRNIPENTYYKPELVSFPDVTGGFLYSKLSEPLPPDRTRGHGVVVVQYKAKYRNENGQNYLFDTHSSVDFNTCREHNQRSFLDGIYYGVRNLMFSAERPELQFEHIKTNQN